MKKLLFIIIFALFTINVYSASGEELEIIIPDEINWTDRFILTELKELRVGLEGVKREIYTEIQATQLETVDKALSYSANTVNFFFVFITIIIMGFGIVGWKTIGDIKKSTKESMDRKTSRIIHNFEKQIAELEKEQKVNIFWRQFSILESDKEKMDMLDKIYNIKPDSQYVAIERGNIYLSMGLYNKVLEATESIVSGNRTEHQPHALYNRVCAYAGLNNMENVILELSYLLQLAPEYKEIVLESEYLVNILTNIKIKKLLK